jgi:hypothetical protein
MTVVDVLPTCHPTVCLVHTGDSQVHSHNLPAIYYYCVSNSFLAQLGPVLSNMLASPVAGAGDDLQGCRKGGIGTCGPYGQEACASHG